MSKQFVSRAGEKLQFAIEALNLELKGKIAADFGSSTGGFVDCLLFNNVKKVYAVDTSYGELAWVLRKDPRVVVMERTNAMHVNLPEKVDLITIDTSWTKQSLIVPSALKNLKAGGFMVSLIKPHYEAPRGYLVKGRLRDDRVSEVLNKVKEDIKNIGGLVKKIIESPIVGEKGKNKEYLALIFDGSDGIGGT